MTSFFNLRETGTFAEDGFHWVLRDRTGELSGTEGTAMGSIGFKPGKQNDECEIGYWLTPPYWGQGLMAEAISAVIRLAFSEGYRIVHACVYVQNVRNQKLLKRLGFHKDGLMENYVVNRDVPTDALLYVLTEAEFNQTA